MKIDVMLSHGIQMKFGGEQDYADFVAGIRKHLSISADIIFHGLDWSKLVDQRQEQIYQWMKPYYFGLDKTLEIGCKLINDVICYAPPEGTPSNGDVYFDVNKEIQEKYDAIKTIRPDSKIVFIGHSLGGQIGFTFAHRQKLDALITMGSPLIHYCTRFKGFGSFPANLESKKMFCFWRASDIVCPSPVSVNPVMKGKVVDIEVKSWNPANLLKMKSHCFYWKSDDVHKRIADELSEL